MPELTRRYVVMTMAAEAPFDPADPDGVFVLKPWKDPAALRALAAYADNCYPELAQDLQAWIAVIESGPVVRGDVGRRNEPHVQADARPAGARRSRGRAAPGGRTRARAKRPAAKRTKTASRKKRRR